MFEAYNVIVLDVIPLDVVQWAARLGTD